MLKRLTIICGYVVVTVGHRTNSADCACVCLLQQQRQQQRCCCQRDKKDTVTRAAGQLEMVERLVVHTTTNNFFWGCSVDCIAFFLLKLALSPHSNLSAAFADSQIDPFSLADIRANLSSPVLMSLLTDAVLSLRCCSHNNNGCHCNWLIEDKKERLFFFPFFPFTCKDDVKCSTYVSLVCSFIC